MTEWRERLLTFLISGGTMGRTQNQCTTRFKNVVDSIQIENELHVLWDENKVQKFEIPASDGRGGRKTTVWRATVKILEAQK